MFIFEEYDDINFDIIINLIYGGSIIYIILVALVIKFIINKKNKIKFI